METLLESRIVAEHGKRPGDCNPGGLSSRPASQSQQDSPFSAQATPSGAVDPDRPGIRTRPAARHWTIYRRARAVDRLSSARPVGRAIAGRFHGLASRCAVGTTGKSDPGAPGAVVAAAHGQPVRPARVAGDSPLGARSPRGGPAGGRLLSRARLRALRLLRLPRRLLLRAALPIFCGISGPAGLFGGRVRKPGRAATASLLARPKACWRPAAWAVGSSRCRSRWP